MWNLTTLFTECKVTHFRSINLSQLIILSIYMFQKDEHSILLIFPFFLCFFWSHLFSSSREEIKKLKEKKIPPLFFYFGDYIFHDIGWFFAFRIRIWIDTDPDPGGQNHTDLDPHHWLVVGGRGSVLVHWPVMAIFFSVFLIDWHKNFPMLWLMMTL